MVFIHFVIVKTAKKTSFPRKEKSPSLRSILLWELEHKSNQVSSQDRQKANITGLINSKRHLPPVSLLLAVDCNLVFCFLDIWDSWVEIDPETASYQGSQAAELILDGLSFTAFVSKSLFLWGNNLLYRYLKLA